jgi:hypothetical protein
MCTSLVSYPAGFMRAAFKFRFQALSIIKGKRSTLGFEYSFVKLIISSRRVLYISPVFTAGSNENLVMKLQHQHFNIGTASSFLKSPMLLFFDIFPFPPSKKAGD